MSEDEKQIVARLHQFSNGYEARDVDAVIATFSQKLDSAVVIGSGCDAPLVGLKAIRERLAREFVQRDHFEMNPKWMKLNIVGRVAWVMALSEVFSSNTATPLTGRLSVVLLKESRGWFIAHLHFSFPVEPGLEGRRIDESPHRIEQEVADSQYHQISPDQLTK